MNHPVNKGFNTIESHTHWFSSRNNLKEDWGLYNMMSIIKVVLVLGLTSVSKQIEAQKASKNSSNWCRSKTKALFFLDPLECPRDTIAYGMTVSIPELEYWRDPKFGPAPANNAPMPLSVCLLCHTITTILGNREDGENVETLQENQPSYQVCIGKGQKWQKHFF